MNFKYISSAKVRPKLIYKVKGYRIPDKKAPRMRKGNFSKSVVTKELYRRFIKRFPEHKGMKWNEFFTNWKEIAETLRIETVTNPLGVKMGGYNGELKMQYFPYKVKITDHKASAELGKRVNHLDIMTKGKAPTIIWVRREAASFNPMLHFYGFMETREISKMKKKHMNEHPESIRTFRIFPKKVKTK